jgi:hypothetical protein
MRLVHAGDAREAVLGAVLEEHVPPRLATDGVLRKLRDALARQREQPFRLGVFGVVSDRLRALRVRPLRGEGRGDGGDRSKARRSLVAARRRA